MNPTSSRESDLNFNPTELFNFEYQTWTKLDTIFFFKYHENEYFHNEVKGT